VERGREQLKFVFASRHRQNHVSSSSATDNKTKRETKEEKGRSRAKKRRKEPRVAESSGEPGRKRRTRGSSVCHHEKGNRSRGDANRSGKWGVATVGVWREGEEGGLEECEREERTGFVWGEERRTQ
jgi:hypothetical protein